MSEFISGFIGGGVGGLLYGAWNNNSPRTMLLRFVITGIVVGLFRLALARGARPIL